MKNFLGGSREPRVFTDRKPSSTRAAFVSRLTSTSGLLRVGLSREWHADLYHRMLMLKSWRFILLACVIFLLANLGFALLYFVQDGSITNARPGSFADAFFFSVETFATLGYGVLAPATLYANWVMTFETLFGLMVVALTTGLLFARISRPTARVLFSRVAVVSEHEGMRTLIIRMGNERRSQIVEARVSLTMLRSERTLEGHFMRRFYDLRLLRERTPIFAMSFSAMHVIDQDSPLFAVGMAEMESGEIELLVTVSGLEEALGQTVHARASYLGSEIRFDHRYVDIFGVTEDGRRAIDYSRFHDTEPV